MLTVRLDAVLRLLLAVAGVVLLLVLWIFGGGNYGLAATLGGWDALALVILTRQLLLMHHASTTADSSASVDDVPSWVLSARSIRPRYAALLVASGAGLSSGLLIVTLDSFSPEEALASDQLIRILAAATVVLAWLILHTGYAMHYATLYFARGRGLSFPGTPLPNFLDFNYFAFAIGAAFATSDVDITGRPIRHAVLWHSVLSFFYNAAVLGIAISTFTGK